MKRTMTYAALASLVFVAGLNTPGPVEAGIMCQWFGYCVYESPGFKIAVVDKQTGKPLADVHALAEWVQYGMHGQYPLLVAQDAISGTDGILIFPPWGSTQGSSIGLVLNKDPVITLYRFGYGVMRINNAPGTDERARVRGLTQNGQTFALSLFRGTPDERVEHLDKFSVRLAIPGKETRMLFREPYLNLLRRIWAEKNSAPQKYQNPGQFFWHIQRSIKYLEEGKR